MICESKNQSIRNLENEKTPLKYFYKTLIRKIDIRLEWRIGELKENSSIHKQVKNSIHLESITERIFLNIKEEFKEMKYSSSGSNIHVIGVKEEEKGGNWRKAILEEKLQLSRTEEEHESSEQKCIKSTTGAGGAWVAQ